MTPMMTENENVISTFVVESSYVQETTNTSVNLTGVDPGSQYDVTDHTEFIFNLNHDLFRHEDPFTIALIVFFSLTFVLGLLGNLFVIIVVARHRAMRTLTNVFFLNLTVGDLLVVCVCIPVTLGTSVYRDWVYGELVCKVTTFLQGTAVGVSVLSMLFISINRYFAIHTPIKAKLLFTRTKVVTMMILIWLLSFGAVSPLLYVNVLTKWGLPGVFESSVCEEKWEEIEDKQLYNIFMFVFQFLLPLVVMGITYMKISLTLWREDGSLYTGGLTGKLQAERILRVRRRTVRNLIFLFALFGCSWFPYYIVNIWLDFNVESEHATSVLNYVYPIVQLLGLSNSTLNPLCYCFLSTGFRKAMVNMCKRQKKRLHHETMTSLRYKTPMTDDSCIESNDTVLS